MSSAPACPSSASETSVTHRLSTAWLLLPLLALWLAGIACGSGDRSGADPDRDLPIEITEEHPVAPPSVRAIEPGPGAPPGGSDAEPEAEEDEEKTPLSAPGP